MNHGFLLLNTLENLKKKSFLQIFTIYLRYLIGGAFVISVFSLGKFSPDTWMKFQENPPLDSAERFFQTMINSGMYWKFIGWSQIIAGFLLITQRFAKLGAIIFFPIILNIFMVTLSYHFHGTPIITGLMLLANIYLIVWDWNTIRFIVIQSKPETQYFLPLKIISLPYWAYLGIIMFVSILLLPFLDFDPVIGIFICFLEGLIGFIFYLILKKRLI